MKFFRNVGTGEIYGLRLEARDTLEEMAAQAPMRMDELAAKIEGIILGRSDYEEPEAVQEGAVKGYKRSLVIKLQDWAQEEEILAAKGGSFLKPAPLLLRIVEKIEKGEL